MIPEFTAQEIYAFILALPIILAAIIVHEIAHGYTAYWLGDPTGKMLGRLTLNPVKNLDPMGTAMFVISWVLSAGHFIFGWGQYAPIQPRFFNDPPRAYAVVSASGPVANLILAFPFAALLVHAELGDGILHDVIYNAFFINVVLFSINLIPLPFFDGWGILGALFTKQTWNSWMRIRMQASTGISFMILFAVFFFFNGPVSRFLWAIESTVGTAVIRVVGG
jgi:Zn-dependent protease